MAHLMKSSPRYAELPVIWNVDAGVGLGGSNFLEDVFLVQYMLNMFGKSSRPMTPSTRAKLVALMVNGKCDAYTIECIKHVQSMLNPGITPDGRVSKALPSLSYGAVFYTIAAINFSYRKAYWANWPVICLDGDNADVTNMVYRELYGTPAP
jgi:hypothetical protein